MRRGGFCGHGGGIWCIFKSTGVGIDPPMNDPGGVVLIHRLTAPPWSALLKDGET